MDPLKPNPGVYLMDAKPDTTPMLTITSGQIVTVEVREGLTGIRDPARLPTPFTDESVGHPLGQITGPIVVEGARPGDSLRVELLAIDPGPEGMTAVMKNYGWLPREFPGPAIRAFPVRDGVIHFGRLRIPVKPSLGTLATMPEVLDHFGYAGPHGGDLDQNELRAGAACHLPVFVPGALLFLADPHAIIGDGIACGTGLECDATVTLQVTVERPAFLDRPVIETGETLQVVGTGPSLEEACRDAVRAAIRLITRLTGLSPDEAYMLTSHVGDFKIGTSPRPVMAVRIVLPKAVLAQRNDALASPVRPSA
jgi:amidase